MKLSDIEQPKNILVMGASGTGKTHLIGTLVQLLDRTLVIASDKAGLETLISMGLDPEVILIEEWTRIWNYYSDIVKASKDFDCIAIDDFGAVQKTAERKVALGARSYSDEKLIKDRGLVEYKKATMEEMMLGERRMQIQQWGELFIALESFTAEILKLPFKVKLFTTLEGVATNPRTQEEHIYPSLSGQVRTTFPARFSLVAESFITSLGESNHYCLTCKSHSRIETKSRFGQGRTWISPTVAKVLAYINHKGEPETDQEKKIGTGL